MTLAFVAFHMRDYQRDTQALPLEGHGAYFLLLQHCWMHGRIPLDDVSRAAICKVTVQRYRKQLASMVEPYFDENGENKRATVEIAKAEKSRLQRAMAGHNGGVRSQFQKAMRKEAAAQAAVQAVVERSLEQPSSGRLSGREAIKEVKQLIPSSEAARAREAGNPTATEPAEPLAGLRETAREELRKSSSIPVTGELEAVIQAKRWAP